MEEEQFLPIGCHSAINKDVIIKMMKNLIEPKGTEESIAVSVVGLSLRSDTQPSIYKIPEFMRGLQVKAFEPQVISFGPYHYGKDHLARMEREKKKAFQRLLWRSKVNCELILDNVCKILEDLYGAYDNLDEKWKKDATKFIEIMIMDGCFMLDFFINFCPESNSLFTMQKHIKRDMLLLENQLPFQLLEQLYDMILPNEDRHEPLRSLVCRSTSFINRDRIWKRKIWHILDMYRDSLLNPPIRSYRRKEYVDDDFDDLDHDQFGLDRQIIPQAIELRKAGIKFKKSQTSSLSDVNFNSKLGVLEMPYLAVNNDTETTLLNVMAFEKLMGDESTVISFVTLITNLIQEEKDVSVLTSNGILGNGLQNSKRVVELFNLLAKGPATELNDHISETLSMVNKHCNSSWKMWWANLRDPENQNPWVIVSIAAASFGFLLQIIQTFYGVYGIYHPNH